MANLQDGPGAAEDAPQALAPPATDEWAHLGYCPNCGARLERRQCKARCFRCGFFQDCSDTIV
jgi:hypothetical protein